MKKVILFTVILTLIFSFSVPLNAQKGEEENLFKRPDPIPGMKKKDKEYWQAKRQRLEHMKTRRQLLLKSLDVKRSSGLTINGPTIMMDDHYTNWQDGMGDVYMTGLCYNAGTTNAAFIEAEVTFYDSGSNVLGTDTGYVYGGTYNVQYGTSGYCTNELAPPMNSTPGEYGFFFVWPDGVSYMAAYSYSVKFTAQDSSTWPLANATLDVQGSVYHRDNGGLLEFYGDVRNYSTNYVTYYTEIHFAVFNMDNTRVLDVDWDFVDGASHNSSTSAIFPGTYEPFGITFLFAEFSSSSGPYLPAFEWYEAQYTPLNEMDPPFGDFATPPDNANVFGSIAVTGWALDDSGVDHVKIYRQEGGALLYIGDAIMVEGARPDVAAAYPGYPNNTRAGWGYMMLTNFLPNGGNGTFILSSVATDVHGKSTTLGTKTIYCDNANAVKPFGAIDTPTQGGTASGSSFVNWGWALTPQPKHIPTDGSTINVFVDGVNLGHPNYNVYRQDIANLFPGYHNASGAVGYFYLDTTAYSDGVHTIQWTATDNEGYTDGIGSRYFSINNTTPDTFGLQTAKAKKINLGYFRNISQINALPDSVLEPLSMKRGYGADVDSMRMVEARNGISRIRLQQLEPVEVFLNNPKAGFMITNGNLEPLPVGSTLDLEKGIYYWQPGLAFLKDFLLVFIEQGPEGTLTKRKLKIKVVPKNSLKQEK